MFKKSDTYSALLVLCVAALALSGCSKNTAYDYGQYIKNNPRSFNVNYTLPNSCYYLPHQTQNYIFAFRSFTSGYYFTEWEVKIGNMLDETMNSNDVRAAFSKITKSKNEECGDGNIITMDINKYEFANCSASLDMTISVAHRDAILMKKRYSSVGRQQCGKMYWGGGFATKNAVQQSTKNAFDDILSQFLLDYKQALLHTQ